MAKKKKSKSKRGGGGYRGINFNDAIDGAIAGAGGQIVQRWLGEYGHPASTLIVGLWRKNKTLQTEGARELAALLTTKLPFIGGGTSPYAGARY